MKPARVGIVGLLQESNTFITGKTTLDDFRADLLLVGDEVRTRMINTPHEVAGFLAGLEATDIEPVPLFLARALPAGVIETASFETLVDQILAHIRRAGPLDGILAAAHGATVAENHPDADGFWLSEIRRLVGPALPLIATIDPHANLSEDMVKATTALVAYSTNPHTDQRETGLKAAELIIRTLSGEVSPTQAAAFPVMAINIQSQNTAHPPLSEIYTSARDIARAPGCLAVSIALGFPYADVAEMGSASLVVTDNDPPLARALADRISAILWQHRDEFEPNFIDEDTALAQVAQSREGPVVLLDMGDNVGGGSPGDSTVLLAALHARGVSNSFICINDPDAVNSARRAGLEAELTLSVGANTDRNHGIPFTTKFLVRSLHDGMFTESEVHHGGFSKFNQGPTAIVETRDTSITVMLTSRRTPPFSLAQLTAFGIDPRTFRVIVAKGVIAPMTAYSAVAVRFIHVDTPGVTRADMTKLLYTNRRRPLFPFEESMQAR